MIWSLDTTRSIMKMGAACHLSSEALLRYPDVMDEAKRRMWKAIDKMANTFAVDLEERDIVVLPREQTDYERDANLRAFKAQWRPAVPTVQFTNGPGQTMIMHLPKNELFQPVTGTLLEADAVPEFTQVDELMRMLVPVRKVTYLWSGWDEISRVWTYTTEDGDG